MAETGNIGIIILAAGGSNRLGEPKQLLRIAGENLLTHTVHQALASKARSIVVVLGARHQEIGQTLAGLDVNILLNNEWDKGMGSSIKKGLTATGDADAIIIAVCDQPFISTDIFNQLISAWREGPETIVASSYLGTVGVPALFDSSHFDDLLALPDTSGAKGLLLNETIKTIPFELGQVDIDTKTDWEDFLHSR